VIYPGHQRHWAVFRMAETEEVRAVDITRSETNLLYPPGSSYGARRKRYVCLHADYQKRRAAEESPFIQQDTLRFVKADTEQEAIKAWQESNSN